MNLEHKRCLLTVKIGSLFFFFSSNDGNGEFNGINLVFCAVFIAKGERTPKNSKLQN